MRKSLLLMGVTVALMGAVGCSNKNSGVADVASIEQNQENVTDNETDKEQVQENNEFPIANGVAETGAIEFYNDLDTNGSYKLWSGDDKIQYLDLEIDEVKNEYDIEKKKLIIKDKDMRFANGDIEMEFNKVPSMYVIGALDDMPKILLITEDTELSSDYHVLSAELGNDGYLNVKYMGVIAQSIFRGKIDPSNNAETEDKYTFSTATWILNKDISGISSYTFSDKGIEVAESDCKKFENTYTLKCDINVLADKNLEADETDKVTIKKGTEVKVVVEPGDSWVEIIAGDAKGYHHLSRNWSEIMTTEGLNAYDNEVSEKDVVGDYALELFIFDCYQ